MDVPLLLLVLCKDHMISALTLCVNALRGSLSAYARGGLNGE